MLRHLFRSGLITMQRLSILEMRVRALLAAGTFYGRVYHRLTVRSPCRVPRSGPAIIVCNHISGLDPVLVQSACARPIHWMMAAEYYDRPGLGWIFRTMEIIPVQRSGRDLQAMRQAMRVLDQGKVVGVFPEGRISPTPDLLPFQPGVTMLAMHSGAAVHPARIEGSQRGKSMIEAYLYPQTSALAFGAPVPVPPGEQPDRDRAATMAGQVRKAVEVLADMV
jgi:1-acyl-sn-glycerol-3-phosphate acyltransferase